ncbi:MAG: hypothetical protein NZR01_07190 [Bryobacteraceae bacterium]|nr:hypothetical protein [Bryobacteraceae bacterium]
MWRSLGVVLAAWLLIQALVVISEMILSRISPADFSSGQPAAWLGALLVGLNFVWSAAGGWTVARIAPERPWKHALYLIVWGETLGLFYALSSLGQEGAGRLLLLLLLYPAAVLAGAAVQQRPWSR